MLCCIYGQCSFKNHADLFVAVIFMGPLARKALHCLSPNPPQPYFLAFPLVLCHLVILDSHISASESLLVHLL